VDAQIRTVVPVDLSAAAPVIAPSIVYGSSASPAMLGETKAIIVAAALVSVAGLATSGLLVLLRLQPGAFRMGTVGAFPLLSVSSLIIALRVLFDVMVVTGAVAAFARRPFARPLLVCGGAWLVTLAVIDQLRSVLLGPVYLLNYRGWDLMQLVISQGTWLLSTVVVRVLLVYAMTRPHAKAAFQRGR
jgi:hypothetical protein